jgi:ATP-dependent helicase/nuclease subunit B
LKKVEIITGTTGAEASEACRALLEEHPGAWLLAPSESMRGQWRQRLPERAASFWTLADLARELAGPLLAGCEVVTPAFRLLILRELVRRHVQPGDYFGRVAGTTGFVRRLADLFSLLKQSEANADALAAAARAAGPDVSDPALARKGAEIAALLHLYNRYLVEHGLCDAEDLIARAVARIPEIGIDAGIAGPPVLLVDGFYTFTPLQLSLLQALAPRVETLLITLTHDASRPVLFARTADTLAGLCERFPGVMIAPVEAQHGGDSGVRLLVRQLLRGDSELASARGALQPVDDAVALFAAPDELTQVEMVAREIRRLLDRHGYRPREIGVLARSTAELAPVIRNVFHRYEIPVWLNVGERLGDNPFVTCVATLLRVWLYDWQRDDLLRLARSSYLGLNRFAVDALERKARARGLRHGRARWLEIAASESEAPLARFMGLLADGQDRIRSSPSPAVFCQVLTGALVDLGLLEAGGPPVPRVLEDADAWRSAWNILTDLCRLAPDSSMDGWRCEELAEAALTGWAEGFFNRTENEEDRVQVLEAYDLRGHDFRAVFILDLIEGIFPRQPREDPFFRDDERQALARHGPIALARSVVQADEERLFFYQAITAARERLFLCYPKIKGDQPALRSFFLDEVERAVGPLPQRLFTLADAVPGPEEAVLPRERLAALAAALGDGHHPDNPGAAEGLRQLGEALRRELPDRFERLLTAPDPDRAYRLSHPAVRSRWSRRGTYTVSELETALACPFQHHLGYRLRIGAAGEGAGPMDQGQILHEVLRRFFDEVRTSGFPEPDEGLERLRRLCRERFDEVPLDARPYRIRLAERALLRYLEGFLNREVQYREVARLDLAYLELAFGPQDGVGDDVRVSEEEDEDRLDAERRGPTDPASVPQPLVIQADGTEVRLSGKIDRIDCTPDGYALVFDYKLGKARERKEILDGKSLQMPVYWLAVEQLLRLIPVGGAYDAMRQGERPVYGRCDLADHAFSNKSILGKHALGKAPFEQLLEKARSSIVDAAALIEQLDVMPAPSEPKTCSYCRYRDCCRPEEAGLRFEQEEERADD